jgi:macrolide transport system ATP-binding/permease protein
MRLWSHIVSVLRNLFRKEQVENQLDDEVHACVDMLTDERIAAGASASEARRTVRAEFGGVEQVKQAVRDRRAGAGLELIWQDVRFGVRQLSRHPGFAVTVVLTLALSIGVNTAIFSLVNALLLKNLPYAHPDRMGTIYARTTGSQPSDELTGIDGEKWELLRDNVPALISAVSGGLTSGVNLQAGTHTQYLHAGRVSAHYFDVLGLHPLVGRNFTEDDDRPQGPKTAILSYALWRTTFGADPNVLGQSVLLKGEPYTIGGVLPENAFTPLNADIYTALQPSREGEGQGTNFEAITRLRDGATWQQANAEINRAWAMRAQRFAQSSPGAKVTYYSVPLQKGETDALRPQVLVLMLAAGFILLIACANLAGLTLVRMLRRTGEMATRIALGASRWQIQRQLWIENLLLAIVGGAAGIGVGFLALRGLLLLLPQHFLPVATVPLDSHVLGFTLCLSLLTSVFFGMLPALTTRRIDLRPSITSRGTRGAGSVRLRQGLIGGEIALTVVLLAASGLLIRTLIHLETMPPGFNPDGVITAKASLDDVRYHDPAAFRKLLNESLADMRAIPGVSNAAAGLTLPYERALNDTVTLGDGKEAGQQVGTDEVYVTPGYFDTLQIPLLGGRAFSDADGTTTQPVVIVNQTFARKFLHGANPVGRYLDKKMIVGVVADTVLSSGLNGDAAPLTSEETIYLPAAQIDNPKFLAMVHIWFQPSWIVRTSGPVEGLTAQMQRALASADPNLPFSGFYSVKDLLAATLSTQRIEVALLTAMASLALLLSALGIFALVANMVAQRTREIGIRMALGSSISRAMIQVGTPGAGAAALGILLGLIFCAGALRTMRSVLYGVGVYDGPTILAVVSVLALVTMIATTVPTLRIADIDPAKTLREE